MKNIHLGKQAGFSVIEILMVMVIIGALASIAIPQYASYQADAKSVSCESNRRSIEMDERNYYLENNSVKLNIDDTFTCPSGGLYVWLISDPQEAGYPKIGCSEHYGGEYTIEGPQQTPGELLDQLINYINNLGLPDKVRDALRGPLELTITRINRGKPHNLKNAIKSLDGYFKRRVNIKGYRKHIDDGDYAYLISEADKIIESINDLL